MGKYSNRVKKKVLVAGDVMLDIYSSGKVGRISPEAPVPILLREKETVRNVLGGAANVAANIAAAGVRTGVLSVTGCDSYGETLLRGMEKAGIDTDFVLRDEERVTTSKLRYIGQNHQQILRVDTEDDYDIPWEKVQKKLEELKERIDDYCIFLLSDYKKGFLTEEISRYLIALARESHIPVFVDVKQGSYKKYEGAFLMKPNREELGRLTNMPVESEEEMIKASVFLCASAGCQYVLTTLGAEGMALADRSRLVKRVESAAREVYDVTGAGDTSIAYLVLEHARGTDIRRAVEVANHAAGIQVSRIGASVVYPQEVPGVENTAETSKFAGEKIKSLDYYTKDGLKALEEEKKNGKKIVFTNGCFDILHAGHVDYLKKAAALGDLLAVGVNSDASVYRLKGAGRPVNPLEDRIAVLASLEFVDYVIPFGEDTPEKLIREIAPDILVKGGDYQISEIVGADGVKQRGGTVIVMPFVNGKSTTGMIEKIRSGNRE